jgi:hypothetical protein
MKNKNLTLLLLGLGALLIFTKKDKKETEGEDDKATPDVGNGKNDKVDVSTSEVTVVDAKPMPTVPDTVSDAAKNQGVVAPTMPSSNDSPYMY